MSSLKKKLLLILSTFLILFVVCEFILRFLNIGFNHRPLNSDAVYHHAHPKKFNFTSYSPSLEWEPFQVFYGNNGNRVSSKKENKKKDPKVYFLGDSFTEAVQVKYKSTFVGLLEKEYSNLKILNYGVGSYSPLIYLIQIKNIIKKNKPKYIIIQLCDNDICNDNFYINFADNKDLNKITSINGKKMIGLNIIEILIY